MAKGVEKMAYVNRKISGIRLNEVATISPLGAVRVTASSSAARRNDELRPARWFPGSRRRTERRKNRPATTYGIRITLEHVPTNAGTFDR